MISSIASNIYNVLKYLIIVSLTLTLSLSILNLIKLFTGFIFGSVVGEVLSIISLSLPFDALAVFGSIFTAITGIGAFMIANKIYALTSQYIQL